MGALLTATLLVFNFLHQNSYPVFRLEAFLLWALACVFFTIVDGLFERIKKPWFFYVFLAVFILDFAVGWEHIFRGMPWKLSLAAGFVLAGLIGYVLRTHIKGLILVAVSAALLSGLGTAFIHPTALYSIKEDKAAPKSSQKPNIFIFILDEHIGPSGMPKELAASNTLAKELSQEYVSEGFQFYTKAYSNYDATLDSIPSYLNAKPSDRKELLEGKKLKENRLLQKLSQEGYRVYLYQSSHLDYSGSFRGAPRKVFTYQESSAGYVKDLPLGVRQKLRVLINNFIEGHHSLAAKKVYRLFFGKKESAGSFMTGAATTERILREVEYDAAVEQKGCVFFVHFLMPHSAYIYDENGKVLNPSLWEPCYSDELDARGTLNTPAARLRKYTLYYGQIRYLHKLLHAFFGRLQSAGLYANGTIVLASDHGSRINHVSVREKYRSHLTDDDFKDAYAAFLAIKNSSNKGENISIQQPSSLILAQAFDYLPANPEAIKVLEPIYIKAERSQGVTPASMVTLEDSID